MARVAGVDLPRNKRMRVRVTTSTHSRRYQARGDPEACPWSLDKRVMPLVDNETRRIPEVNRSNGG